MGAEAFFCPACARRLARREKGYCPLCGQPAPWPLEPPAPCSACLISPPLWEQAFFHAIHADLLRELILRCKFQGQLFLARPLAALLASHPGLAVQEAEALLPIPLHPDRLAHRGFNQALEIARPLARMLRIPLAAGLLLRTRSAFPQTGLSRSARLHNLRQAFAAPCPGKLAGRRLMLVDDVMTTGATMHAATAVLLAAGARSVSVAALGRTSL
jgi:ComF family protein